MGCPYAVFGLKPGASLADVKSCYIKLAKAHHPDKLSASTTEADKLEHAEKFRSATMAFRRIEEDFRGGGSGSGVGCDEYWGGSGGGLDEWVKVFRDVFDEIQKRYHTIKVPVTLKQIHKRKVLRLEVFLRDCDDPVYISIDCGDYPKTTIVVSGRIIKIKFVLKKDKIYSLDDIIGNRDLFATCHIKWHEYITGVQQQLTWVDGKTILDICIPPFADLELPLVVEGRGLWGEGSLYVSLKLIHPTQAGWRGLCEDDQKMLMRMLTGVYVSTE